MNAAIDGSGKQDKALADDVGATKFTFSKWRSGVQAFPVASLDDLPAPVRLDFHTRQLDRLGYIVQRRDPVQLGEELLARIEDVNRLAKLYRTVGKAANRRGGEDE